MTTLDDLPDEKCSWCGGDFVPRASTHKYCSEECRRLSTAAFEKQWRAEERERLKCRHCGEPILNAIYRSQRYCSGKCQNAERADRTHGRVADLRCVDCGEPIPEAGRRDTKLCLSCARERHRKANRERSRLRRQSRGVGANSVLQ